MHYNSEVNMSFFFICIVLKSTCRNLGVWQYGGSVHDSKRGRFKNIASGYSETLALTRSLSIMELHICHFVETIIFFCRHLLVMCQSLFCFNYKPLLPIELFSTCKVWMKYRHAKLKKKVTCYIYYVAKL